MQKAVIILVIGFGIFSSTFVYAQYQTVKNIIVNDSTPPTVLIQPDAQLQAQCITCSFTTYRLVRQLNCGAVVAIEDVYHHMPRCKMVPKVSLNGAIKLAWNTKDAVTVFVDHGVGHVSIGKGARIVTPTQDTTYNMTVVSEDGLVGACSAQINISTANADANELLVIGDEYGLGDGEVITNNNTQMGNNMYKYNADSVNHITSDSDNDRLIKDFNPRVEPHTATMAANGPLVRGLSFFTSGTFIFIAFLLLLVGGLWLILKHGVR